MCVIQPSVGSMQSPSERPSSGRLRLGDARLLERLQQLEAELSEMDTCADELEAEIDELHSDKQYLEGRLQQAEVLLPISRGGYCVWL